MEDTGPDAGAIDASLIDAGPYLTNGQAAVIVLGQADFTSNFENANGRSSRSLYEVHDLAADDTHLWVADGFNYRVLQWNGYPTTSFQPASVVIGQPNFTGLATGPTSRVLGHPDHPSGAPTIKLGVVGQKIAISDPENARVLVWAAPPSTSGAAATIVLGATAFDVQGSFTSLGDIVSNGADLLIAKSVKWKYWSSFPNTSGAASNNDINLPIPYRVAYDTSHLVTCDRNFHVCRLWNGWAGESEPGTPDVLVGNNNQIDSTCRPLTANRICQPSAVLLADNRLFVADTGNRRVLVFEPVPTTTFAAAKYVLGAPDFETPVGDAPISASVFAGPSALAVGGGYLWVADGNRVLGFKLGQP